MPTPLWLRNAMLTQVRVRKITNNYHKLYTGDLEEKFTNQHYRNLAQQVDVRDSWYRLNLSRKAVDTPNARTRVAGISCADEKARNVLTDFWTTNQLDFESRELHQKAYEFGNSVLMLSPDEDGILQAYVHSPGSVVVFYDPAKPRDKVFAVHSYTQQGNGEDSVLFSTVDAPYYYVVVVYTRDVIQKWISVSSLIDTNDIDDNIMIDVSTIDMRLDDEIPNYIPGLLPVFHCRTSRDPLGRSRLADVMGVQNSINDCLTAMMCAIKESGYRQRFITYEKGSIGGDALDTSGDVPGSDELEVIRQGGPGNLLEFAGKNVELGSFDASLSNNFLEPIDDLAGYMASITETPVHYFTSGSVAPSGESYRMGEKPLQAVVEDAQGLFNAMWQEVFSYVLRFYGLSDVPAEIMWKQLKADDLTFWQTAAQKVALGVPKKVVLQEAGYDEEMVTQWEADGFLTASVPVVNTGGNNAVVPLVPNTPPTFTA